MRGRARATAWAIALFACFEANSSHATDLIWQVESPFRFFKASRSFALHEAAFNAVRGDPSTPLPADIIWRTERALNDPDCKDASTPDRCAATAGKRYQQSRLGWAAQTLGETCYESNGRPRRYSPVCERKYSWGAAKEDYVLPEAHTVVIGIAPEQLAGVAGDCVWSWQPRKAGGKSETRRIACANKLTIARVPYALDRANSGVTVTVGLPDGRELVEPEVVVEDLFIVALGDSFASGESNPDRPVQFSAAREMLYGSLREDVASRAPGKDAAPGFGLASSDEAYNPKVLPRRLMDDEAAGRSNKPSSPEFAVAFEKASARWLSRDCHRSQYGYPFRVAIELALENRHRSVTLASFTCSGSEVAEGMFLDLDPREGASEIPGGKVRAQLDQLSELICRGTRSQRATYTLPVYWHGSTQISMRSVTKAWCPPLLRKRAIDLVLMSIGGNDVGFGPLAVYSLTESITDLAPIAGLAGLAGHSSRFSPQVSRLYLEVLDERMQALKQALHDGFGVPPARVVQSSYEPIHHDETGALCGSLPSLGMDVHPGLRLSRQRLQETADFLHDLLGRLECIAGKTRARCPAALATGAGTGFTLVTEHIPEFAKRGLCARDPKRALADSIAMRMPRKPANGEAFKPYSPAGVLPYAHHWRLFRTPNDAFLAANTHREGTPLFDILQPAYAGLYSGAIHPTAEAHAIVADHVLRHVRAVVDRRETKPDMLESKAQ